jgi:hypothetical protein
MIRNSKNWATTEFGNVAMGVLVYDYHGAIAVLIIATVTIGEAEIPSPIDEFLSACMFHLIE